MTADLFEPAMREFLHRVPFQPFVILLRDGRRIAVDAPRSVSFGGGAGTYLSEFGEPTLFDYEEVTGFTASAPTPA